MCQISLQKYYRGYWASSPRRPAGARTDGRKRAAGGHKDGRAEAAVWILMHAGTLRDGVCACAGGRPRRGPLRAAPYMTVVTSREAGQKARNIRLLDPPLASHRVGGDVPWSHKAYISAAFLNSHGQFSPPAWRWWWPPRRRPQEDDCSSRGAATGAEPRPSSSHPPPPPPLQPQPPPRPLHVPQSGPQACHRSCSGRQLGVHGRLQASPVELRPPRRRRRRRHRRRHSGPLGGGS